MDHPHYAYSAMPFRAKGLLPQGLHVFAVIFLEHWEFQTPQGHRRDPRFVGEFGSFNPDYRSWTQREYGLRIGVFRLIEALHAHRIQAGVAANAMVLPRVPSVISALNAIDAQWLGHGISATRMMHSQQSLTEQQAHIEDAMLAFKSHLGLTPIGWMSQDWGTSPDTWRLLSQAGLRYTLDWGNDDQPYWMTPADDQAQPLLALPMSSEWDDVQAQWLRHLEPSEHADLIVTAAKRMASESQLSGQGVVMGLGLHPWVWGMPSRVGALRELLVRLNQIGGLEWRSPDALFQHCATPADHAQPSPRK